ncbi:MAG TPA: DUF4911 domain-containing protein [Selenomonadales bacterium]|nr:DUF4911 domain-containing protein [Selenomonadales bacterium]
MLDPGAVFIRVRPRDINFVNQIMEGYEYYGVVTTLDRAAGLLVVRATPDTSPEVRSILADLPVPVEFLTAGEYAKAEQEP